MDSAIDAVGTLGNGVPTYGAIDERTDSAVIKVSSAPSTCTDEALKANKGENSNTHTKPPINANPAATIAVVLM